MAGSLSNAKIARAGSGKLSDGGGLILYRTAAGGRWTYRYQRHGVRREMGLGSYPVVTLAAARKARDAAAAELSAGRDPIQEKAARVAQDQRDRDKRDPTVEQAIQTVFEARRGRLRGDGERGRWMSPLRVHILPRLGARRLSSVTPEDVRDAVRPIWRSKHPTALKIVQRLRIVFRGAQLMGWDADPLTVDRAAYMLGEHIHEPERIPATRWQDAPALLARLQAGNAATDRCLAWIMLTMVRTHGCVGARLDEVDSDGVWTVPASRIKGSRGKVRDFAVPLAPAALAYVEDARTYGFALLFPSPQGRPLSSIALEKRMTHHGQTGRPHGLRTTFRTWAQDHAKSREVAEMVLGHRVYSEVEGSYARSDLLARRATLMREWADFLTGETTADVVPIRQGG